MEVRCDDVIEWRSVVGYEGIYEVSERGDVRRCLSGKGARAGYVLKGRRRNGYFMVQLCRGGVPSDVYIHHLVAAAFLGERPETYEVNHIDTDKMNNHRTNLEYLTKGQNLAHAYANGRARAWTHQNWRRGCKSLASGG